MCLFLTSTIQQNFQEFMLLCVLGTQTLSKNVTVKICKKVHNPAQVYLNGTEGPTPEHVVVA